MPADHGKHGHHMKHGSETFYIEGEGLLVTQVGGRTGDEPDPVDASGTRQGSRHPGPSPAKEAVPFRFSRVGPKGTPLNNTITKKLAQAMVVGGGGDGRIPAGYTYLGQFVDHDLTSDPSGLKLSGEVSPAEMVQNRSPRLDLDSLYGAGPGSPESAKLYEADGLHMKVGTTIPAEGVKAKPGHDLPRVGKGGLSASQKAADRGPAQRREPDRGADPPRDDQLPQQGRLQGPGQPPAGTALHPDPPAGDPALPVDAAPRLPAADLPALGGQRRVQQGPQAGRARRRTDRHPDDATGVLGRGVPAGPQHDPQRVQLERHISPATPGSWTGCSSSRHSAAISAGRSGCSAAGSPTGAGCTTSPRAASRRLAAPNSGVNMAMRIDTRLTNPLEFLPPSTFGGDESASLIRRNLAFRNLARANLVRLASGQQMVTRLKSKGVDVTALTRSQILNGSGGAKLDHLTAAEKNTVASRTPLWFYILREAELNNGKLKGVGARIVAETFHRAMEGSRFSIVREPTSSRPWARARASSR